MRLFDIEVIDGASAIVIGGEHAVGWFNHKGMKSMDKSREDFDL